MKLSPLMKEHLDMNRAAREHLRPYGWLTYEQSKLIMNRVREIGWDEEDVEACSQTYRLEWLNRIRRLWVPGAPVTKSSKAGRKARWIAALDSVMSENQPPATGALHRNAAGVVAPLPFQLFMDFEMPVGGSAPNHLIGQPHTRKPDADNLGKLVQDRLEHWNYFNDDDCVVARAIPDKKWCAAEGGGVTITIASRWLAIDEIREHLYKTESMTWRTA